MKTKKILICVVMMLFLFQAAIAETAAKTGNKQEMKQEKEEEKGDEKQNEIQNDKKAPFFKSLLQDQGRIWSSPFRMKGKDFLVWGGVALVTGVLIANDEVIYREFKEFQGKHKWVDDISPHVTKLGLGEWNLGIAGAFYLGGLVLKDKKAKETARLTLMTFIHTGLVVQLGKHLSGRQEPGWDSGNDHWAGPSGFFKRYNSGEIRHYDAFPSGHTISIFGTATVISEMYKKTIWVPVLSYSVATLCGLSRVTEDTHWLSDVFLGAVLGYAIGKFVVKRRNRLDNKLTFYPMANSHQIGIGINYVF
jgi:membrane-associated phospholipid phosphatase